ncbi:hypothetical protein [Sphingomonas melonis]|nr:hypothetical protein [Sphingomonas melonis]
MGCHAPDPADVVEGDRGEIAPHGEDVAVLAAPLPLAEEDSSVAVRHA